MSPTIRQKVIAALERQGFTQSTQYTGATEYRHPALTDRVYVGKTNSVRIGPRITKAIAWRGTVMTHDAIQDFELYIAKMLRLATTPEANAQREADAAQIAADQEAHARRKATMREVHKMLADARPCFMVYRNDRKYEPVDIESTDTLPQDLGPTDQLFILLAGPTDEEIAAARSHGHTAD